MGRLKVRTILLVATDNVTKQIRVKLDGRRNKMVFIRGFETVADHFGIRGIINDGVERPEAENEHGIQAAWDDLNRIALEKLRLYVTTRVDDIVTNGDKLHKNIMSNSKDCSYKRGQRTLQHYTRDSQHAHTHKGRKFLNGWQGWMQYIRSSKQHGKK